MWGFSLCPRIAGWILVIGRNILTFLDIAVPNIRCNLFMKVLILYPFHNHDALVDALCRNLNKNGIEADSFNMVSWRFNSYCRTRRRLLLKILKPLMIIPKVRGLLINVFRNKIVLDLSENYDIIDIHFFGDIFDNLIDEFIARNKRVKITIWGSDFYRASNSRREQQRNYYRKVDLIQNASLKMQNDFLEVYPECNLKTRIAHFGIIQFDTISDLLNSGDSKSFKDELGIPEDKLIIACGTNGNPAQQHFELLTILGNLPTAIKNQIFLLVPMTYGCDRQYIETVRQVLHSTGLPNKLFVSNLSIPDVCKLRIISDIAITIQKTDAFSAAIQEHIFAGSLLIAGNWLPYCKLNDNNIYYLSIKLEELGNVIEESVCNINDIKIECENNRLKMRKLSSWEASISSWVDNYNQINL